MGNVSTINYDKIYTIDEVYDLFLSSNKKYKVSKLMQDLNTKNPKFLKIYICDDIIDIYDEEHKKDIEDDYILSHCKYQYYIAEICIEITGEFLSISNMIWNMTEDVFSFSCNIAKCHKNYDNFKKYTILKYITPDRKKRYDGLNEYKGLEYDLNEILNTLKKTTSETIINYVIENMDKACEFNNIKKMCDNSKINAPIDVINFLEIYQKKQNLLEKLNEHLIDFYDNNEPI